MAAKKKKTYDIQQMLRMKDEFLKITFQMMSDEQKLNLARTLRTHADQFKIVDQVEEFIEKWELE